MLAFKWLLTFFKVCCSISTEISYLFKYHLPTVIYCFLRYKTLPLYHFTTSPLYHFTTLPFYTFTILPLYRFTTSPLHHFTILPLYHFTTLPLHRFKRLTNKMVWPNWIMSKAIYSRWEKKSFSAWILLLKLPSLSFSTFFFNIFYIF